MLLAVYFGTRTARRTCFIFKFINFFIVHFACRIKIRPLQTCLTNLSFCPFTCPASIDYPLTKIVGILTRAAAIRSPAHFITVRNHNKTVKLIAIASASVESAIRSLVARGNISCRYVPSQYRHSNSNSQECNRCYPHAIAAPIFTASVILSRFICPGTISL